MMTSNNQEAVEQEKLPFNPILWGLIGYLFLLIFRPYEYWLWLGDLHIERIYMIMLIGAVAIWPGKRYNHHAITTFFLLFFVILSLSVTVAYRPDKAWDQVWKYFKQLVLFFIILLSIRDKRELKILVIGFIAVNGIYIGKSLWEFFVHGRHIYRMGLRRLIGIDQTYNDPNTFAATVIYALPFAWALYKSWPDKWLKRGLIFYAFMSIVAIGFTGSRSGMLSFLVFILILWYRGKKKFLGILAALLIVVVGWISLPNQYKLRFETIFDDSINPVATESANSRIQHLKWGLKLYTMKPVLGWGAASAPYVAYDIMGAEKEIQLHNMLAQLLTELGTLGLLACLGLIFILFYTGRKILNLAKKFEFQDVFLEQLTLACLNTLILLLFQGVFGHNLYRYNWLWIGALLIALDRIIITEIAKLHMYTWENPQPETL